jgi:hypothetical protein
VHGVCEERGCKEYKVLEAIVKGWKAKVVKVALEVPPKKCVEGTKSDCGMRNQSLDVRSTTLLVRQYVGSRCT